MFKLIGFVIRYAPHVIAAVTLVEGLVSKNTPGAEKRALVVKTVKEVLGRLGVRVSSDLESLIGQTVDIAVTLLNLFGVFTRKEEVTEAEDEALATVPAADVTVAAQSAASRTEGRLEELEGLLRAG